MNLVAKTLFGNCHVDGFFLEYDSERAGGFEPLRYIQNQKVVLGLVTSKDAKLENKDEIIKRIHEAEKYVPLNQLSTVSTMWFCFNRRRKLTY